MKSPVNNKELRFKYKLEESSFNVAEHYHEPAISIHGSGIPLDRNTNPADINYVDFKE